MLIGHRSFDLRFVNVSGAAHRLHVPFCIPILIGRKMNRAQSEHCVYGMNLTLPMTAADK